MKKLFLLAVAGTTAWAVSAQSNKSIMVVGNSAVKTPATMERKLMTPNDGRFSVQQANTANKPTAGGSRWYIHSDVINVLTNGQLYGNNYAVTMWQDSTVLQRFLAPSGSGTVLSPVNFSSVSQFVSPVFTYFNDGDVYADENGQPIPGLVVITPNDAYRLDSIAFGGLYVRGVDRPDTIVDTLILSVASSNRSSYITRSQATRVGEYLPNGKDTLYGSNAEAVDSIQRAVSGSDAITWKVVLDPASRTDLDTTRSFSNWVYEVPNGGLNVPAGKGVVMSVTFKSGDTWQENVDTVRRFHRFMPQSSENSQGGVMPNYYYEYNDRNMSGLMHYSTASRYTPTIILEAVNTAAMQYEFHRMMAHLSCTTCENYVGVGEYASKNMTIGVAYPNPARTELNIPFTLKENAGVTVQLTNLVGQTVKTQFAGNFAKGEAAKAVISTSDLAPGTYLYTVTANGQRQTGRVSVVR